MPAPPLLAPISLSWLGEVFQGTRFKTSAQPKNDISQLVQGNFYEQSKPTT